MKPNKPKKWLFPAAVARDYEKALRCVAAATVRETETLLARRQDDDEWYADWNRVLMDLPRQLELPLREAGIAVRLAAEQTDRFNGRQFRDVVRSAYGADIVKPDPDMAAALENWTAANAALIKSIPEKYAAKVQNLVMQAAVNGTSQADLIKQIRKTYRLPYDHARLIANDQIGKLNGQLARMRQQNIGITHYRWRGTLDARERDSHLRREGRVFAWDDPPSDGHPGNAVRCRCHAEPIFPELVDLDAALFGAGGDNRYYHAEMTRRGLKPEAGMPDLTDDPYTTYGYLPRGAKTAPPPAKLPESTEAAFASVRRAAAVLAQVQSAGSTAALLAGLTEEQRAILMEALALLTELET